MPAASPCLPWDPVLCGHSDECTAWECDCALLLLGLLLPHPQNDPCNMTWAEQLHFHWFLIGICSVLAFNKALGCGFGIISSWYLIMYLLAALWLCSRGWAHGCGTESNSLRCWWTMGIVMLAPGIWTLLETATQASRRGFCLAVATCKSVVPRLLCTTGGSREGQSCLSPGEKDVYWQMENKWVYFLPVCLKIQFLWHSPLWHPNDYSFSLPFKLFKIVAVKAVLAHECDHAPHLLSFFLFPLKTPKLCSILKTLQNPCWSADFHQLLIQSLTPSLS